MSPKYLSAVKAAQQSMNAGRLEAAVTSFERAIEIDTSEPLAYVGLAETLLNQGQVEAAVGAARQAVLQRPNFGRAQLGLANCLCRFAETSTSPTINHEYMEEALESYDKARALNGRSEPIPILDDWRQASIEAHLKAQRIRYQEERVQRWEETRKRHGLAFVPHGPVSDADQIILDEESKTENGKRWQSEYYRSRRKY